MGHRCSRFVTAAAVAVSVFGFTFDTHVADAFERIPRLVQVGTASWYGPGFHGRQTASGKIFDQNQLSAAHRTLPLNTKIKVTNLENGKAVVVVVNDRGPYVDGRVLDLSKAAASRIGMVDDGTAVVKIEPASPPKSANTVAAN